VREKHCWLAGLGWLTPTSEQGENKLTIQFQQVHYLMVAGAKLYSFQDYDTCIEYSAGAFTEG